jgi:hypothetical protein
MSVQFDPLHAAKDGSDFNATSRDVTLWSGGGAVCAQFPILTDSLAQEGPEEFEVSFVLLGQKDAEDRLLINKGRDRAVAGLRVSRVKILDQNSKILEEHLNHSFGFLLL